MKLVILSLFHLSSMIAQTTSAMADTNPTRSDQCVRPNPIQSPYNYTRLDTVPEDVQYLIASEFAPSSVFDLAQSSQALRQATLPLIYHSLKLVKGEKNSKTNKAYKALIAQFRSKQGKCYIAGHVLSLTVEDNIPASDLLLVLSKIFCMWRCAAKLAVCVQISLSYQPNCKRLMSSWNTPIHIPRPVLSLLYTTFPHLALHVHVLNRESAKLPRHRQVDTQRLSSPLLASLTCQVLFRGYRATEPTLSEWPLLTRLITSPDSKLKVLRIESKREDEYDGADILRSYDGLELKLARLDVGPDTRLPALEEFDLREQRHWGGSRYAWDREHCNILLRAGDWSKLRVLDFGEDVPVEFFHAFTGHVLGLEKLRFGIGENENEPDFGVIRDFIGSVKALESIDLDQPKAAIDVLWPVIEGHKATLRELILRPSHGSYYSPQYLEFNLLEQVVQDFPRLERLGWDVPCAENGSNYTPLPTLTLS